MVFKPRRCTGVLVGIAFITSLLGLDALLLWYLRRSQVNLVFFVFALFVAASLPLLGLLSYLVYALASLRYQLHRDALTIVWGATQRVIPMESIHKVIWGKDVHQDIQLRGPSWPGHLLGHGHIEGIGRIVFYATEPIGRQLLLATPATTYGISPANLDGFLDAFEIRKLMGPLQVVPYQHCRPDFLSWPIWRDRLAHVLLALGVVTNLALFGYLCCGYASQAEIFRLPAIGLVSLLINSSLGILIHAQQRVGAYLLWGGAVVVQLLSWLAVLNMIG